MLLAKKTKTVLEINVLATTETVTIPPSYVPEQQRVSGAIQGHSGAHLPRTPHGEFDAARVGPVTP